jgi:hypothetical protein
VWLQMISLTEMESNCESGIARLLLLKCNCKFTYGLKILNNETFYQITGEPTKYGRKY